jgi:hypothetical protein
VVESLRRETNQYSSLSEENDKHSEQTRSVKSRHVQKISMAAFKNYLHRSNKLPLSELNRIKHLQAVINIVKNNGYDKQQIIKLYHLEEQRNQ